MEITLIALGGTISGLGASPTSEFYNLSENTISALLEALPLEGIKVRAEVFLSKISHEISERELLELAKKIQYSALQPNVSGIVITMGTNALEDIAYFIGLVVKTEKPIVFTGAHYPQNNLAFDGKRNVYNAIIIAASKDAMQLGVLVTFNDCVVTARDAIKTMPGLSGNFSSEGNGIIGHVISNKFMRKAIPVYKHTYQSEFNISNLTYLPQIVVIYAHLNMNDCLLKAAISAKVSGIVSAGFGKGYQPKPITEMLHEAVQNGIPVVRCSRSGISYTGKDPGYDTKYRFIVSRELSPQKAALLLAVAITKSCDFEWLESIFEVY